MKMTYQENSPRKRLFPFASYFDCCKYLALVSCVTAIVCLGGCTKQPTTEQLEVWRKEASDRNAQILADQAKKAQQREWKLLIQGQTANSKAIELNWQQILELANEKVSTTDPNHIINPQEIFEFQGITVSTLLKKIGLPANVQEITFVCYDSYQVTVKVQDLLDYPIILAVAKNGKPIAREQGGPIYLVFPYTQYPQIKTKYIESFWAFYVSNIILGTETVKLRVGSHILSLADLDQLQQITINKTVGYRVGWPSGKIKLHGVRIRDILSSSQIPFINQEQIVISTKVPVYQKNAKPLTIPSATVRKCDIILATRWGDERQLIPAKMGGPITLAYGDNCPGETNNWQWLTFVEELN
ncbi:MAG TPA: molybdopterin-dependent oxidoreductase [Nostocaceae cyanobacterium]|nr:molybdopterin-dependent oxidoreductase [Nostocaceae cyanobacterium]